MLPSTFYSYSSELVFQTSMVSVFFVEVFDVLNRRVQKARGIVMKRKFRSTCWNRIPLNLN